MLLNQIFAIILYILFFCWLFFKFKNVLLVKKNNCKNFYKNIKKDSKNAKISKKLFKVFLSLAILLAIYLAIGLVIFLVTFALEIIDIILLIFTAGTFYFDINFIMNLFYKFISLLKCVPYYLYLVVYTWLARAIYINNLTHKELANTNK